MTSYTQRMTALREAEDMLELSDWTVLRQRDERGRPHSIVFDHDELDLALTYAGNGPPDVWGPIDALEPATEHACILIATHYLEGGG